MKRKSVHSTQYAIRCKIRIAQTEVSLKLVAANHITYSNFKEQAWEEALEHVDNDTLKADSACVDLKQYEMLLERTEDGREALLAISNMGNTPLKHQLPKPARLVLQVRKEWTEMQRLVKEENLSRSDLENSESVLFDRIKETSTEQTAAVEGVVGNRERIRKRNLEFERFAVLMLAQEINRQERIEREATAVKVLQSAHAKLCEFLDTECERVSKKKRYLFLLSKNLSRTNTLLHQSLGAGTASHGEYNKIRTDPTREYTPTPIPHRWMYDMVAENADLRIKYKKNQETAHAAILRDQARPVVLPHVVTGVKSLRELLK